ncbi:aminoglycoside 6-adenylyltransferase [Bacillus sp. ISL-35]|uniref:aminoglycoside 6-adenylyltransferase n=1 Tax=Bacillus sp. ISL-35 TaxID=2819122 RepID=UPI001BE7BC2F|nr:aminoglycoside 6-adenylyltransferase [Bacillus sp. ISL-35]MBT2679365.1 aminoglycoside 6-adenylyltransferase [Bacillus sp. ISL-35]MBT2703265.1 aminoglycoside 6-adenylyltransferase [Chryseobacterium sp. ISL-80]
MYSIEERKSYFDRTIRELVSSNLVEGIVQIGSGVIGYNDEYSDIDLMVATDEIADAEITRDFVRETLCDFGPIYIKNKQFSKDIFLVIAIMHNGLEFNISIVPREFLSVKSQLWKVLVDKTGLVTEKMNAENDRFLSKQVKYNVGIDVPFEFFYCARSLDKELKRNNLVYALKMLEEMRDLTLIVQALNEDKKLHQFKAYSSLDPKFIESYLSTFSGEPTVENIRSSSEKLTKLFINTVEQSLIFSMDSVLDGLLQVQFT